MKIDIMEFYLHFSAISFLVCRWHSGLSDLRGKRGENHQSQGSMTSATAEF